MPVANNSNHPIRSVTPLPPEKELSESMVLYQSFWSRFKREAMLFGAVYVTCLLLAMLFNLVSFSSERLHLSVPLHEAPASEVYMLQALAPLPIEGYRTVSTQTTETIKPELTTAIIKSKKKR
jgi:hypothetical protein